jgi:hypothetical protein
LLLDESTLLELDRRLRTLEETTHPIVSSTDSADYVLPPQDLYNRHGQDTAVKETDLQVDCAPVYTSTSSFVQQVASVVGSGYEHVDKTGTGIGHSISHSTAEYNVKDLVLPPRQLADNLLQCYWELFHPVLPILHHPTFNAAYSQLWQPIAGNKAQDVLFHSTLNIVLALGCQRNEALEETEREDLSKEFYRRSAKLISLDALDASSLQIVQLLVLRGSYLLYTPYADRCWNTVGVALRVAQAVGLQSVGTAVSNQLNREMRRRVWHSCVMLDW